MATHDHDAGPAGPHACPSSPLHARASLLGLVRRDGHVDFLGEPLPVNEEFIQISREGASLGARFRFTAPCMESGCAQWESGARRCRVATRAVQREPPAQAAALPACGIRPTCRWFTQEGEAACRVCSEVVYDGVAAPREPTSGQEA